MARGAAWTTSSSSGCGAASNTRRFTCMPMATSPRLRPASGLGWFSTTRSANIRAMAIARRGRCTKHNAGGYVDDRLCRPAALPPLPEPARKAGKCSPSPTSPPARPPTQGLIKRVLPAPQWRSEPTSKSAGLHLKTWLRLSHDRGPPHGSGCQGQVAAAGSVKMVYRGGRGSRLDDECASPFSDDSGLRSGDLDHRGRSGEMVHFVGLDVSVKATSVCVVDDAGKVILEQKVPTDPADLIAILTSLGVSFGRIGIEAGPLSQWLVNALTAANLPVICVETRHMKALLTAQQISKTDRNDARGIAQMMRVGLFKPVHVKTLVAQEQRMLLTSRKLLQRKLLDVESDLRGTLRNFGLKVGVVRGSRYEARVRELVEGFPGLAAIVEPLLSGRRVMRQQFAVLHKMLLDMVRRAW